MGVTMMRRTATSKAVTVLTGTVLVFLVVSLSNSPAFAGEVYKSSASKNPMSTLMKKAFQSSPKVCQLQVQKAQASYSFYNGPVDGAWGAGTAAGIAAYAAGGQGLSLSLATLAGSKGIIWHI
jgi:hypothetical protein